MRIRNIPSLIAAFAVTGASALADGEAAYDGVITQTQTAFEAAINALKGPAAAIVVAGIGIWLIPRVVGFLKTCFTSGKGR